jgi:PAS domain S-box-containing protein
MNDENKIKILIMEDEELTRKSIAMYLVSKKFKVLEAKNGRIGLELFRREKADLILLDLRMPEMDGMEVLSVVSEEFPETPVIVISATDKVSDSVEALRLGAWDYVIKPIQDMTVLYHVIQMALERARLIRENRRYQERLETEVEERTRELMLANRSLTVGIEELKRAEIALRESEKAYKAIFNAATAALLIIDREKGTVLEANSVACKWYGYGHDEFLQMSAKDLIMPEDHSKFDRFMEKVKTGGHAQFEMEGLRKDGSRVISDVVGTEVVYKGQNHLLAVFRDITEQKNAEEKERLHQQQLIQADKMASLGILVSGVAHEINNPNNFIMVNAPILTKVWKNVGPILEDHYESQGDFYIAPRVKYSEMKDNISGIISGIMEGAQRINNVVTELKDFARPAPSTTGEKIDIDKVVQRAITLLSNLINKSTNRFSVDYGENLPGIDGNFQRLEQVLVNLVQNSCQALETPDRGLFISTGYDAAAGMVRVVVKDEGYGMTRETMEKIKNPFFTTKREQGGTGLGLSISSRIIEDHNGTLRFDSVPGEGTTAVILLPVKEITGG